MTAMPGRSVIPELDDVYKKWEQRGPKGSGDVARPRGGAAPGGGGDGDGVSRRAERAIESGKQKWRDRFGDKAQSIQRRHTRDRRKVVVAVPAETAALNSMAQFKTQPTIQPEQFLSSRPFMGQCCACMPNSQKDLITSTTKSEGMRNLMDYRLAVRGSGPLARQFPILGYVVQRRTAHKYPDLSMAVLTHPRVVDAIQLELQDSDGKLPQAKLEKKARTMLNVMKSVISNYLTKFSAWVFMHFMNYLDIGIQIHKGQMKMIETAHQRGLPIVFLPLHRSHLDYILISHTCWNYNLRNPYIAAGDNLNIFFFNSIMRGLGGFFIRRKMDSGSKKDAVYRAVLQTYMEQLLLQGQTLEFFLEGGRSRTGKALHPKGGLLSVVMETLSSGVVEDALLIPVSINYEKILDGDFKSEQMGIPKKRETFFGALKGIWNIFCRHYGNLRVDFAQPFSLRECMQSCQPSTVSLGSPSSSSSELSFSSSPPAGLSREMSTSSLFGTDIVEESQRQLVNRVGQHVTYTCVQTTAIMSTNLLAFLLLTKHRQGCTMRELARDFALVREEVVSRKRDIGFAPSSSIQDVIRYAAELLGQDNIAISGGQEGLDDVVTPNLDIPSVFELSYYGNVVISVFLLESLIVNAVIYLSDINLTTLDSSCPTEVVLMSKDEILETAVQLSKLLKYEFLFVPPCRSLEEALADTLDSLVLQSEMLKLEESQQFDSFHNTFDKQWATRLSDSLSWAEDADDEDTVYRQEELLRVNLERSDCKEKLRFFHRILAPILEAYLITGLHIIEMKDEETPETDFLKKLHKHAKERVTEGVASYGESASLETLKLAIKSFKSLKIVESYTAGSLQMMGLRNRFDVKQDLKHYVLMLEALRE